MTQYKTAKELGITQPLYDSLLKVADMLCKNEIVHVGQDYYDPIGGDLKPGKFFDMSEWRELSSCGSVCCIGGSIEHFYKVDAHEEAINNHNNDKPALYTLFHPFDIDYDKWYKITNQQAVQAIHNYLTHNDAKWTEVCSDLV